MAQLLDLSVGHVAGLVAMGVFVLQLVLPSLVPLLVVGSLSEKDSAAKESAATWSLVAQNLHSSYWPALLRSDATVSAGRPGWAGRLVWLTPIAWVLLAIAAVVTPLGLYETLVAASQPEPRPFHYALDPSSLGAGTMPRSDLGFNRVCGGYPFWACPGATPEDSSISESEWNMTTEWENYDMRIPHIVYDIFTSGLQHFDSSVSGPFDIEWRTHRLDNDSAFNNGSDFLVGDYRQLTTLLLNDKIEVVEGLIVDSHNGGVGFRNHSLPSGPLEYGARWSEDILFVLPETQCVDTNLTLDYKITDSGLTSFGQLNPRLTDRGGFVDIDREYVWWDLTDLRNNTQNTLDLRARAFKGAWLNNGLTMQVLNITRTSLRDDDRFTDVKSSVGKQFLLVDPASSSSVIIDPRAINLGSGYGDFLPHLPFELELASNESSSFYPNPFNISKSSFYDAELLCTGIGPGDNANITNIHVSCGSIAAMARFSDNPDSIPASYSVSGNWTQPMYSCASAAKAAIKTVSFESKGSNGDFTDLNILGVVDKEYESEEAKPLWIVEDALRSLNVYEPLWGLANSTYKGYVNTSTLRKESLWLSGIGPAVSDALVDESSNLPGSNFYSAAFKYLYQYGLATDRNVFDYSGGSNMALFQKWFELTRNETGTAQLINLMWTDLVANSVVGTKGWASQFQDRSSLVKRGEDGGSDVQVPIYPYQRRVGLEYAYGIPAFIACAFAVVLGTATLAAGMMRRTGLRKLDKYINHTSLGRVLVSLLEPETFSQERPRREWKTWGAGRQIILGRERPYLAEGDATDETKGRSIAEGLLAGYRPGTSSEDASEPPKPAGL